MSFTPGFPLIILNMKDVAEMATCFMFLVPPTPPRHRKCGHVFHIWVLFYSIYNSEHENCCQNGHILCVLTFLLPPIQTQKNAAGLAAFCASGFFTAPSIIFYVRLVEICIILVYLLN